MTSISRILCFLLVICTLIPFSLHAQDDARSDTDASLEIDIDALTLIDNYIEALGGSSVVESIRDMSVEGDVTLKVASHTFTGQFMEISAAPNKKYALMMFDIEGESMSQEDWCDGTTVVESGAFKKGTLKGDELAVKLENNEFNAELRLGELGYTFAITDKKIEDGRAVYYLEVKKKHGTRTWIIDAETFMRVGAIEREKTDTGIEETRVTYMDYDTIYGMAVPMKWILKKGHTTTEFTATFYELNTNPPASTFIKQ
jgi:hypothetical protein